VQGGGVKNLLAAITTKMTGSALSTAVGGRIFLDRASAGTVYPYIVWFIVTSNPEKTFTEDFENTLIQFSIFSTSSSVAEIADIYAALDALFDECTLAITGGDILLRMHRTNLITMTDDIVSPDASNLLRHWAVEYSILVEKF
jgi:hypothetical protein